MTDRLSLYNGALLLLGERRLASLTEEREPRRVLDAIWNNGAVKYCLQQGFWNFAMRTAMLDYNPSYTAPFGYQYQFTKPDDCVRTAAVCSDEYFNAPILRYADEAGSWYADLQTIYVQFVSNGSSYGSDLSLWPETFTQYVESYLAFKSLSTVTAANAAEIRKEMKVRLVDARSKDAMEQPAKFLPRGTWSSARIGYRPYDPAERR